MRASVTCTRPLYKIQTRARKETERATKCYKIASPLVTLPRPRVTWASAPSWLNVRLKSENCPYVTHRLRGLYKNASRQGARDPSVYRCSDTLHLRQMHFVEEIKIKPRKQRCRFWIDILKDRVLTSVDRFFVPICYPIFEETQQKYV